MAFGAKAPPIQVHLCVHDGAAAIAFYQQAFGGTCTFKQSAEDGRRILHANVELFGGEIMLHDEFPEFGGDVVSPIGLGGASLAINVNLADPAEVDRLAARAEQAGAVVTAKPEDAFWGSRYARVRDPFGHIWAFNAALRR